MEMTAAQLEAFEERMAGDVTPGPKGPPPQRLIFTAIDDPDEVIDFDPEDT